MDSDYVRVVRCKDCMYGRPPHKNVSPEKFYRDDAIMCENEEIAGDEPFAMPGFGFCSYGKTKKGE